MDNRIALKGGYPVREKMLPYAQQWLEEEEINAVIDVLRSDFLTTGPKVTEFEQKFAEYVGAKYAVAVANGTAALHAAVSAAGIGTGDEVITTPMTFAASANCVLYQGGTPVFADILEETYNIDPDDIEDKLTSRTKAIIPVHFTGQPVDLGKVHQIAKQHNLLVIEDAAHALGAEYKGSKIGGLSDMTVFSFHPVKHITTGEGGMITTNDSELYKKLVLFRGHGITRERSEMIFDQGPWYYEMQNLGFNYRITDVQAALGIEQLLKSEVFVKTRRKIVQIYDKAFRDVQELVVPYQSPDVDSSWHLYVIKLCTERLSAGRREVFEALRAENIGVNVHYLPVHLHPYYRKLGYEKGLCPKAENLYERIITLPLFPKMTEQDAQDVVRAVNKVLRYYSLNKK